mmetsp:Transcript_101690/g.292894  ORF Transcript_101690/g.292894 Transcript_101690/m.292894 type:complete len:208 (-) Transcript_101690:1260-1883(-)
MTVPPIDAGLEWALNAANGTPNDIEVFSRVCVGCTPPGVKRPPGVMMPGDMRPPPGMGDGIAREPSPPCNTDARSPGASGAHHGTFWPCSRIQIRYSSQGPRPQSLTTSHQVEYKVAQIDTLMAATVSSIKRGVITTHNAEQYFAKLRRWAISLVSRKRRRHCIALKKRGAPAMKGRKYCASQVGQCDRFLAKWINCPSVCGWWEFK